MTGPDPFVAVVGAGPAGLMAAEVLAGAGRRVVVFERMPSPARKLLIAGRGGLNLTHSEPLDAFLDRYGPARAVLEPILRAFPPSALVEWAEALGQPTFVGSSGRVFPKAMKASPLLRAWLRRLSAQGVEIRTRHTWTGWDDSGGLVFETPDGVAVARPRATVLALGGASWPRLGSTGDWVVPLAAAGLPVTPLAPANCGIRVSWSAAFAERFAGTPLKRIALSCAALTRRGEAMITRTGLEGGAVYALGPAIRASCERGPDVALQIDLLPDITVEALAARLARPRAKQSLSTFLRKTASLSPAAIALLREGGGPLPADAASLARRIKAAPLAVTGLAGLERAISTAGGVGFAGLDAGLMAPGRPGLFLAGEMLDWEAPTGGYLLQACFATGRAAGAATLAWLERQDG